MSVTAVNRVLLLFFSFFCVEIAGYLYGLRPTDVLYHHLFLKRDMASLSTRYELKFERVLYRDEFPSAWAESEKSKDQTVIRSLLSRYDFAKFIRAMLSEVKKYPPSVLNKNLSTIYFLEEITVNGIGMEGAHDIASKSLYIANRYIDDDQRAPVSLLKSLYHDELSAILIKNYSFDERSWREAAGESFQYQEDKDPIDSEHRHAESIDEEVLLQRGLLKPEAETSVEDDVNAYAEVIFTEPSKIKKLIKKYPAIKQKYQVFKAFYLSVDTDFTPLFEKIDR